MTTSRTSRFAVGILLAAVLVGSGCSDGDPVGSAGDVTVDAAGGGDFTTIQAAVDRAAMGARVVIRPGTYVEQVTLFKPVTLSGSGPGTELRMAGAPTPMVDESGASSSSAVVIVSGTSDVVIENLVLTGPGDGIQVRNSRRVEIRGVDASGNGDDGVDVRASSNVTVSGTFNGNGDKGVQVRDASSSVVVRDSTVQGNTDRGVRVRGSSSVEVLANTVDGNGDDGVQVRDSTTSRVVGNTITDNLGYGLRIESSPDTVQQDNTFGGNAEGDLRIE